MLLKHSRMPLVALLLASAALAVHWLSGSASELQLDRAAIAGGEWWRVVTCHLTHWSADHLAWDVMTFALLGAACELISRPRLLITLLASGISIPFAVLLWQPQLQTYRGLSGLDSALFGLLAAQLLREKFADSDRRSVLAIGMLIVAFLAKTAIETVTGKAVFADSVRGGFVPVPVAHLVGLVIGALAPLIPWRRESFGRHPQPTPLRWPAL